VVSLALVIAYWLVLQSVLPTLFPVEKNELIALLDQRNPSQSSVVLLRFIPQTQRLIAVSGQPRGADTLPSPTNASESVSIPLSWRVGVPIDRVVSLDQVQPAEKRMSVLQNLWQGLWSPATVGASWREMIRWWLFTRTLSDAQTTLVTADTAGKWQTAQRILVGQSNDFHCPVAVLNTTGVGGVASELTQLLEPAGFLVVKVGDAQLALAQTQLVIDDSQPECLAKAQQLNTFMVQPAAIVTEAGIVSQYRAPIIIRVGYDLADALQAWKFVQK
jgi:hypothetical protein